MSNLYVALLHYPVIDRAGRDVATSITCLDLHDIARSCLTYGVAGYYVVNPLRSQLLLGKRLLDFWLEGPGRKYNATRADALTQLKIMATYAEVEADIAAREGHSPLAVVTSAKPAPGCLEPKELGQKLTNAAQSVVLIFGTGNGLAPIVLENADFRLTPLRAGGYNHLSVRSAVAIYLDRIIGEAGLPAQEGVRDNE